MKSKFPGFFINNDSLWKTIIRMPLFLILIVRVFILTKLGANMGKNVLVYSSLSNFDKKYLKYLSVGDNCVIGRDVMIFTHDGAVNYLPKKKEEVFEVSIGNNCFLGARSIILPNVVLGKNTIVGAGSVVTKSFEGNCIIAGNPAKFIKKL